MIDYKRDGRLPAWSVITRAEGGSPTAWPVWDSPQAALGEALLAVDRIFESKDYYVGPIIPVEENGFMLRAESLTHGYPERPPVEAWVLPTWYGEVG